MNKTRRYLSYLINRRGGIRQYTKYLSRYAVGVYIADLELLAKTGLMPVGLYIKISIPMYDMIASTTLKSLIEHKSIITHYFPDTGKFSLFNTYIVVYDIGKYRDVLPSFFEGKYNKLYTAEDIKKLHIPKVGIEGNTNIYRTLTFDPNNVTDEDRKTAEYYLKSAFGEGVEETIIRNRNQLDFPPILKQEIHRYEEYKRILPPIEKPEDILKIYVDEKKEETA